MLPGPAAATPGAASAATAAPTATAVAAATIAATVAAMLLQLLLQGCFCCRAPAAARRHGLYTRKPPAASMPHPRDRPATCSPSHFTVSLQPARGNRSSDARSAAAGAADITQATVACRQLLLQRLLLRLAAAALMLQPQGGAGVSLRASHFTPPIEETEMRRPTVRLLRGEREGGGGGGGNAKMGRGE